MLKLYFLALLAGAINGLFATGGGIITLPLLSRVLGDEKKAYLSVVAFVLPLSIISGAVYKENVEASALLLVASGAFFGGITGAVLSNKVSLKYLKYLFGAVIIYTGVKMLL